MPCDYHVKLARQAKEAEEKKEQRERDRCDPNVKPPETAARKKLAKDLGSEEEITGASLGSHLGHTSSSSENDGPRGQRSCLLK